MNILVENNTNLVVSMEADYTLESERVLVDPHIGGTYELPDQNENTVTLYTVSSFPRDLQPNGYYYTSSSGFTKNTDWSGWTNLQTLIREKQDTVTQYRRDYIDGGVIYGGVDFQTGPISRDNIVGTASLISGQLAIDQTPNNVQWISTDNRVIIFTPEEFIDFTSKLKEFITDVYLSSRIHKDQIGKLTTKIEVLEYNYQPPDFIDGGNIWPTRDLGGALSNHS